MAALTQSEFDAMERNGDGYLVIPDNTDCTKVDFKGTDRIIFGAGCQLGNRCKLGNRCELGNLCKLGDACLLGDGCKLGDECKLGNRCELGNLCKLGDACKLGDQCKLGNWCQLGDACKLGDACLLGDWCRLDYGCQLGDQCKLGNECKLGNVCKLGDACLLGDWCELGDWLKYRTANFEGGQVRNGMHICIGPIGSRNDRAYFYMDDTGKMFVRTGCWFSDSDAFFARVREVHGETIYANQYLSALACAQCILTCKVNACQN